MRCWAMLLLVVLPRTLLALPDMENSTTEPLLIEQCPVWGCRCSELSCCCSGPSMQSIPSNLSTSPRYLIIEKTKLEALRREQLAPYAGELLELILRNLDNFRLLETDSLSNLSKLMALILRGLPNLQVIHKDVFRVVLPRLRELTVVNTGLKELPFIRLIENRTMMSIDFSGNNIKILKTNSLEVRTESLLLEYNSITEVEAGAFSKCQIFKLSLKGNTSLRRLHLDAFLGIESLSVLDLSQTSISELPVHGLERLEELILKETYLLKVFPASFHFKELKRAYVTYPYHCCAFSHPAVHRPKEYAEHKRAQLEMALRCRQFNVTEPALSVLEDPGSWGWAEGAANVSDLTSWTDTAASWDDALLRDTGIFHEADVQLEPQRTLVAECGELSRPRLTVRCSPGPDAFSPCEDLMGNWLLRLAVWLVSSASLLGNAAVLVVLLAPRRRLSAPRFLMWHLAASDLAMGCYLVILAVVDVLSMGAYFNYAIDWQNGPGCQVAGFLTVLASELSVFTLALLTGERWYTITYAIHMNRRLRLVTAMRIMAAGYVFAIVMAALPLFDVSGYYVTSICLPLRSVQAKDRVYLGTLLGSIAVAFLLICACYVHMFYTVRGGTSASILQRSDSTKCAMQVAKRMTLLVFTDFACWAPISFFGLTALLGLPLIDVPRTKILLVFFYPLNACANPYLYALLTRQFRMDLAALLSRSKACGAGGAAGARTSARHRGACRVPTTSARVLGASAAVPGPELEMILMPSGTSTRGTGRHRTLSD